MDSAEEDLKKKLTELERTAFDPQLSGRQEEIWARLVGVHQRARFLQEETSKASNAAQNGDGDAISDELIGDVKKVSRPLPSQLRASHADIQYRSLAISMCKCHILRKRWT